VILIGYVDEAVGLVGVGDDDVFLTTGTKRGDDGYGCQQEKDKAGFLHERYFP
jgi:hypothetical protein